MRICVVGVSGRLGQYMALHARVDFTPFMVAALEDAVLIQKALAIVGRRSPSALALSGATT